MAQQQTTASAPTVQKLPLTAALVLTPEFCATVNNKGGLKFPVGKAACSQLPATLNAVFTTLTRVDDSSKAGNVQVLLEPKFTDVSGTQRAFTFSKTELVVLVEWTIRDREGNSIWIETAQGSGARSMGNNITLRKNLDRLVHETVQQMADESATKMSSAPQLLNLHVEPAKADRNP
jgi:hypothetical protein